MSEQARVVIIPQERRVCVAESDGDRNIKSISAISAADLERARKNHEDAVAKRQKLAAAKAYAEHQARVARYRPKGA